MHLHTLLFEAALLVGFLGRFGLGTPMPPRETDWSRPKLVFEGPGYIQGLALAADEYGQVHAFWSYSPDLKADPPAFRLYYDRLDRPESRPVEIFTDVGNLVGLTATASNGKLALLWRGGEFASASAFTGTAPSAWTTPVSLQTGYSFAGQAVARDGAVWIIYGQGKALFTRRLDLNTNAWGEPQWIADTQASNSAADAARLSFAADGTMHAVWAEYQLPNGWPPLGVFYAHSSKGGQDWTPPRKAAAGLYNQPNVLAGPGSKVYMAWVGAVGVGGKYFQESNDGGSSWGEAMTLSSPPDGGSEGAPNLALDSSGVLHMSFSVNRCLIHRSLRDTVWTPPECISEDAAPKTLLESPAMAVGLGNQLHALFWTDRRQVWYTRRQLAAPTILPKPMPALDTSVQTAPTSERAQAPAPASQPGATLASKAGTLVRLAILAILAGAAPAVIWKLYTSRERGRRTRQ